MLASGAAVEAAVAVVAAAAAEWSLLVGAAAAVAAVVPAAAAVLPVARRPRPFAQRRDCWHRCSLAERVATRLLWLDGGRLVDHLRRK